MNSPHEQPPGETDHCKNEDRLHPELACSHGNPSARETGKPAGEEHRKKEFENEKAAEEVANERS